MKAYCKLLVPILLVIIVKPSLAQDDLKAPSLQVGLSGLSFARGDLDAALIAEIIAEKQKEVKIKLVKNMLLNKLGVDNGLFYAFIDQNIEILLNEKDSDIRVKNLLENVVNLAFVIGYADYYIQTIQAGTQEWEDFKTMALSYGVSETLFGQSTLRLKDFAKIEYTSGSADDTQITSNDKAKILRNRFVGVVIDLFAEVIRQNDQMKALGLLRTNYLQNYISMNSYLALADEVYNEKVVEAVAKAQEYLTSPTYQPQRNLIDRIQIAMEHCCTTAALSPSEVTDAKMYSDKLIEPFKIAVKEIASNASDGDTYGIVANENYTRLKPGVFNNIMQLQYHIDVSAIYASGNADLIKQYGILKWYLDAKVKARFFNIVTNKKPLADKVFTNVTKNLNTHIKYYNLIKALSAKGNNWKSILKTLSSNFQCDSAALLATIKTKYASARTSMGTLANVGKKEIEALEKINSFMDKLDYIWLSRFSYIREYEEEIKPAINNLSKFSRDFSEVGLSMQKFSNCVISGIQTDLETIHLKLDLSFINIFTKVDEFEKASTYADFVNQLSDAGDVFSDEEMRKSINKIISFVRSYIKVEEIDGKLAIKLDVEGFLAGMQRIPYNRYSPFSLHFTVGANTASFGGDLTLSDNTKIRNYSYVGEKIGVKFKVRDYKYLNSFSKGETFSYWGRLYRRSAPPKEPVISNVRSEEH
ncbi:MAG: hypothetical protein IM607_07700, partial [Cytophagales bacterium]|nr:hypothetical protein [Cytophagales bacterium]